MRTRHLYLSIALLALIVSFGSALAQDRAHDFDGHDRVQLVLVEHAINITNIDQGEAGPSIGDLIAWGPNPMFDATSTTDTGATTQGICTTFEPGGACMLLETIVFPDGSTLQLQGIQPGTPQHSTRVIVGGSGNYLGAMGTVAVDPTDDLTMWTKTFDILFED